jgi:hypothetical protein
VEEQAEHGPVVVNNVEILPHRDYIHRWSIRVLALLFAFQVVADIHRWYRLHLQITDSRLCGFHSQITDYGLYPWYRLHLQITDYIHTLHTSQITCSTDYIQGHTPAADQ